MKKYLPIYLYGLIIVLVGFYLLFSENSSFQIVRIIIGVSLLIGSVLAFITTFSNQRKQLEFDYHEMHALAMLVYSISLIFFCDSSEKLISFTFFLFIFYAFSEIIFCNWLFNLEDKVVLKIIIIRILLGLFIGVGSVAAMSYAEFVFPIFSLLFIMIGINILLYVPVMKVKESIGITKTLKK